jgi:hypothetical protein
MGHRRYADVAPWMLFAFPLAIAVPIIAGMVVGGPMLGFPVAALVAIVIVGVALRKQPETQRRATPKEPRWRPALAARRFAVAAVVVLAGAGVGIAGSGVVGIIGWGVLAMGLTLMLSLVFLEVGYSEDRARAAEQRHRRPPGPRATP